MTILIHKGNKWKYLKGLDVPKLGDLFIDKMSLTMDVPLQLRKVIESRFVNLVTNSHAAQIPTTAYKNTIKPTGGDSSNAGILIQCSPTATSGKMKVPKKFFRLECNPSHADLGYLKAIVDFLLKELGGYKHLIKTGSVTRLDVSVDADYIGPTDLLASYGKMKKEYTFSSNGKIESKYLGAKGSSKQILLYDKPAEITHSNKNKPSWMQEEVPDHKKLRIEVKLKYTDGTLQDVASIPNPFADLTLTAYPEAKSQNKYDPVWSLFLTACRFEGVDNALLHLHTEDGERCLKLLETEGKTEWWNPAKVWQGLPNAIKAITYPKGSTPSLQLLS